MKRKHIFGIFVHKNGILDPVEWYESKKCVKWMSEWMTEKKTVMMQSSDIKILRKKS